MFNLTAEEAWYLFWGTVWPWPYFIVTAVTLTLGMLLVGYMTGQAEKAGSPYNTDEYAKLICWLVVAAGLWWTTYPFLFLWGMMRLGKKFSGLVG